MVRGWPCATKTTQRARVPIPDPLRKEKQVNCVREVAPNKIVTE